MLLYKYICEEFLRNSWGYNRVQYVFDVLTVDQANNDV